MNKNKWIAVKNIFIFAVIAGLLAIVIFQSLNPLVPVSADSSQNEAYTYYNLLKTAGGDYINRFIDNNNRVVCYVYNKHRLDAGSAMDCFTFEELGLE